MITYVVLVSLGILCGLYLLFLFITGSPDD